MRIKVLTLILILIFVFFSESSSQSLNYDLRWRLDFENETPKTITITYPTGEKRTYWYFKYKITNNSNRDLRYLVNIKVVIDKTKPQVAESKVPEIFYNAEIPEYVVDKEEYLNSLITYYDTEFSIAKREILKKLRLYQKLSNKEEEIYKIINENLPKSVFEIAKAANLEYAETEKLLNNMVVNNLAISKEFPGNPIFIRTSLDKGFFLENYVEVEKKIGEQIAGWEIISFENDYAILKKNDVLVARTPGSTIEYLFCKFPRDLDIIQGKDEYFSGMFAKGDYKGRQDGIDGKKYNFERKWIPKGKIFHGIAIFDNISSEMDFMAIVVSGLIEPIVRRKGSVFAENQVLMIGYKRPGDEFTTDKDAILPLYRKWVTLKSKKISGLEEE